MMLPRQVVQQMYAVKSPCREGLLCALKTPVRLTIIRYVMDSVRRLLKDTNDEDPCR